MKHTPAPWKFGNTQENQFLILGGPSENYICNVTISQTGGGEIAKMMEAARIANANLIVLAPEILEVLKVVMTEVEEKDKRNRIAADIHNNTNGVGIDFDYMTIPPMPLWYQSAKEIMNKLSND